MNKTMPSEKSIEAARTRLRPKIAMIMLYLSRGEIEDPARQIDTAVTEPGSIYLGAWSLPGGPDLVFRTLGDYPTSDMVAVYALSSVNVSPATRLPLCQYRWLALNQPTRKLMSRMDAMIKEFKLVFDRHTTIEGVHFGMRELAAPLLQGIDITLVESDLPDPLLLFGTFISQFYAGRVRPATGPSGEKMWPLEGSTYNKIDLIAHALNVPNRPEVAEVLLGPLTRWSAAQPLRDFLDVIPDEDCFRRFRENPQLAGAALYGALAQWEAQGFPTPNGGRHD